MTARKLLKGLSVLVALGGVAIVALVAAPSVFGRFALPLHAQGRQSFAQGWAERPDGQARELTVLAGRGAEIGVSIRDVESSDKAAGGGVVVEDVRADSPAEKAGLKRSDVIVEFDGERVRSARQFTRLVQETPPGRSVKTTIVRDGQRKDVQVSPTDPRTSLLIEGDRLRERLGDLGRLTDRSLPFDFNGGNFRFEMPPLDSRGRLGVTVDELTPQLASYFGAKDGVLVATVSEDSPAARAGLKAGDVITKVGGEPVRSREDLVQSMREARDGADLAIAIVRDKKESTVTVKLEARRPSRTGRPA